MPWVWMPDGDDAKKKNDVPYVKSPQTERINNIPCRHNGCQRCGGRGVDRHGNPCVHSISCPCPRCSPRYL